MNTRNEQEGFQEAHYLATYPDVAAAVSEGRIGSAWEHYQRFGRREGRMGLAEELPAGKVPVAFFFFNRPELTRYSFARIRQYRPDRLLLISDGPRHGAEEALVTACRDWVDAIDWPCEVSREYASENLGCRKRLSTGLRWVFDQVESAVILEDDCLAHPDFFSFCHAALHRYQAEERVMHISGSTFIRPPNCHASAWFSRHSDIWGWATWRRAFEHYDVGMRCWRWRRHWPCSWLGDTTLEQRYWRNCFEKTWRGEVDTWDYQWHYTVMRRRGLSVVPRVNLITNVGHGPEATHTHASGVDVDMQGTDDLGPLMLPLRPRRDRELDTLFFMRRYALGDLPPIARTHWEELREQSEHSQT